MSTELIQKCRYSIGINTFGMNTCVVENHTLPKFLTVSLSYLWHWFSFHGSDELEANAFLDETVAKRKDELRCFVRRTLETLEIWFDAFPTTNQVNKSYQSIDYCHRNNSTISVTKYITFAFQSKYRNYVVTSYVVNISLDVYFMCMFFALPGMFVELI